MSKAFASIKRGLEQAVRHGSSGPTSSIAATSKRRGAF
jgi:hypothetical protein